MPGILFLKLIAAEILKGRFAAVSYLKYYQRWKASIQPGHSSLTDRLPWLSFPAIDLLDAYLQQGSKVFEYGGGGSTLFFLDRTKFLTSIEHDTAWFSYLKKETELAKGNPDDLVLILPELKDPALQLDYANPDDYYTSDPNYANNTFRDYASYIDKFEDGYFDLIVVDGRSRPSCIKHALPKLKKGGWLVVDNAERQYYLSSNLIKKEQFKLLLNKTAPIPFTKFYSQTNIWIKL